jgi:hypothetical protein
LMKVNRFVSDSGKDIVAWLLLLLITWSLYSSVVNLWWTYDDTQILKHAILYRPYQYFLKPLIWQELSANFFTPLLTLSFDTDIHLFSLNPKWFYLHHLTVIWLCSVMIYVVLKRWVQGSFAFLGSILFLIGSPVAVMSQQLMTRHYLEGLLVALIALYLFVKGLDRGEMKWSYYSACAYTISIAAKEVYVPLVFVLLALPCSNLKNRLKHTLPHFVAFILYVVWRWWMLGTTVGGYGNKIEIEDVILLPNNIVNLFFGLKSIKSIVVISVAVFISIIFFLLRRWRGAIFGLWVGAFAILPLIAVSNALTYRHVLVTWVATTVLLVFVLRLSWNIKLIGKIVCICLLTVIAFQIASQSIKIWNDNLIIAKQMSAEGKFIFEEAKINDVLRQPAFEGHYFEGINWLKSFYYGRNGNAVWFYDDIYLCENSLYGKRVWGYAGDEQKLKDITNLIPDLTKNYCNRVRFDVPLIIKGNYAKNVISWELGPYSYGRYSFIIGGVNTRKDIPQKGSLIAHFQNGVIFRVRYESPEGWITYSPYLTLKVINGSGTIHWERY